jgi:hypothetical protein
MRSSSQLPRTIFDPTYGNAGIRFLAGELTESEYLKPIENNRRALAVAHFTIGMMRLAEGEREKARDNFGKAVATNAIGTFNYEWARAYLERMKADPTWPRRIPDNGAK